MMTLPEHRVQAVNTAADHENRMHGDEVAGQFGFRGGLVPGVNVYGYMTVPVVAHFGHVWLERGWMRARFVEPFYDGDEVVVRASVEQGGTVRVEAGRAWAEAGLHTDPAPAPLLEALLPGVRPSPTPDLIRPGLELGSFTENLAEAQARLLPALADPYPLYADYAHPTVLLGLANEILVRNFRLPAWIHTSSEVCHYRAIHSRETVHVTGRIRDAFARKGHEFLIADVTVCGDDGRLALHAVHVAIWQPRRKP
ncbi:MAG: hypothetical protein IT165_14775 [Bryobacterales bacterium]|nr:hypothetical protein [Bryobacterales bacterium]